jgi:hypothetical protein
MTHSVLYVLPDGKPKSAASYSSRSAFKFCKKFFKLTRVDGWRTKREGAAMDLGKAAEAGIVHQVRFGEGGVEKFVKEWENFKKSKDFAKKEYTEVEESWENCLRIGTEWMEIFAIRQKSYPFQRPQFQLPLYKKIFPGTSYDAISNTAYIDIFSEPPADHPLLMKVSSLIHSRPRPLITDVKTASKELPDGLIGLDPQLLEYAWQYFDERKHDGLDVAFLWLVKKSHGFKFGSRVTLLKGYGPYQAGAEVRALDPFGLEVWVGTEEVAEGYARACSDPQGKSLRGKALDQAAEKYLKGTPGVVAVPQTSISKQQVQFGSARLTRENILEMGKVIGQTTVEMVVAHEQDFYPAEPGLRYPSEKCNRCDMRYICAGDGDGRDRFLSKVGEEWLDTMVEE